MKALITSLLLAIMLPLVGLAAAPDASAAAAEDDGLAALAGEFGVDVKTLVSQSVSFIIVAVVLYMFAVKPISATLEDRQKKIADGLQYAEEMKTQLAEAEKERAAKVKEAAVEAQRILSEAREQSKELIDQKTQEAIANAESIIRKASESTELERQKMLSDVRKEVAALVVATSSKVLAKQLSEADRESLSNAAAQELAS